MLSPTIAMPTPRFAAPRPAAAPAAAPVDTQSAAAVVQDVATDAMRSFQALPVFLYPSVTGTAAERSLIFETLDRLPMKDVGAIPAIRMMPSLEFLSRGQGTPLGVTFTTGDMMVSRSDGGGGLCSNDLLRYIVLHESGHAHDFQGGILHALLLRKSNDAPWGSGPFPTRYAESMRAEDFAEGHAFYHSTPDELARLQREVGARTVDYKDFNGDKWRAMDRSEQPNALEAVVAQKPFRETGRLIGELTSNQIGAGLHTALGFVSIMSTINLATSGFQEIIGAVGSKDAVAAVRGGLALGAGVALAVGSGHPLLGPAALALLGARRGLDTADRIAAAAPAGAPRGSATAAAIGGAVGGVVGGVAAPLAGTLAGYAVAGPVGGVVGLVTGSLLGFRGGSALGARAGLALTRG